MLIGAHVSLAGGLYKAVERGVERNCDSIQIFNQSPRTWRPTNYSPADFEKFRDTYADSPIESVLIHAIYLFNCASTDDAINQKSLAGLTHALRFGAEIGACGVVLHPGSAKTGSVTLAIKRAGETMRTALADSENCELHLENTAGAGGTLGRSFGELAALIEATGGDSRVKVCLDSCHLFASGYDISTPVGLTEVLNEFDREIGLDRLGSLHVNDSQMPFGSNRDRHANLGEGELGRSGCATFLSEPRFNNLPVVLEVPGNDPKITGPGGEDIALARQLREEGLASRKNSLQ